jgi:hypothetical protein
VFAHVLLYNPSQRFLSFLSLLGSSVAIHPQFPLELCFLYLLLPILAAMVSSTATLITKLLSIGPWNKLFVASLASNGLTLSFHLVPPSQPQPTKV